MATSNTPQETDFTRDVIGRYVCNGLDEALRSADKNAQRPDGSPQDDARPFDVIVIGGGSFGPILAQHLFYQDKTHSHRILVLEAGRFVLTEHVQNLPMLGLNPPGPTNNDPGVTRNEVWGLPWRSNVDGGFPGLAYCIGGRSLFFGGWSPRLLDAEMPGNRWPDAVVTDLNNRYFDEASEQIGTDVTNDFIDGPLQLALRQQLFNGITNGAVPGAIPLAELPQHLNLEQATLVNLPPNELDQFKLEAPLAVRGRPPRSGFFALNKFSSVPLLMEAARAAEFEAGGDDVEKRLMVVPDCHVTRLVTAVNNGVTQVTEVLTNQGSVPVPEHGAVVLALGTIESTRLALISFPNLLNANLIGQNLLAHLRSNLTIRISRQAITGLDPNIANLQEAALFVKGRRTRADGSPGFFHLQISAAGLNKPGTDSEAELFKAVPDIDTLDAFRMANDTTVVITMRGIGEMQSQNPRNQATLGELDEFGLPRAFVSIADPRQPGANQHSANDRELWDAMDKAADEVAQIFAGGQSYEVLTSAGFQAVPAGHAASEVAPFDQRRDGLGTTHHEAGTLWMGNDPGTSVTNADGRFHYVENAYVAAPALFPTTGSPNPMLTGTALARRMADHLAKPTPTMPDPGFKMLFDGSNADKWRMSTIKNQLGRDNPGHFIVVDSTLEAVPGTDIGLYWYTEPTPADFILKLEWLSRREDNNSGVFIRFPNPDSRGYNNTAFVGVDFGFEVQIDQRAAPDGAAIHKTGAIYGFAGPKNPDSLPVKPLGAWNVFEIRVQRQSYTVLLNGEQVNAFTFKVGSDQQHPDRSLSSKPGAPRYLGLQTHTGRVAFRNIQIKAL
jgi:choline dehydrogenase-like flavoprotein